jgi:alpha-beta hydrolase superfamily lysophospholipase
MKQIEHSLRTADGLTLHQISWESEITSTALVCLVHGLGEHSGRYQHVAEFFGRHGFTVTAFDLRGHGRSGGPRGHTPSFEALMQDIDVFLQAAARQYGALPRFLYGHSLGGILVLNYALRRKPDVAGVIATSSGLRTALEGQTGKLLFAQIAGRLFPTLSLASGLDPTMISRDPAVVDAYIHDPLVHNRTTLGFARSVIGAIGWAFDHAEEFPVPLLLVHGSADKIAFPSGSQDFAQRVKGDCTLKIWEGLAHETHNEPEKEQVLTEIVEWMRLHLPVAAR